MLLDLKQSLQVLCDGVQARPSVASLSLKALTNRLEDHF